MYKVFLCFPLETQVQCPRSLLDLILFILFCSEYKFVLKMKPINF